MAFMAFAATAAAAAIEIRDVMFAADEIPATNPRIERRGEIVTHVEVFGKFEERPDGSVKTRVVESAVDMDATTAQLWVREARAALGAATPKRYSRIRLELAIAKRGKYAAFEAILAGIEIAPGYTALTAWKSAQVIQDDFEGFQGYYTQIIDALSITKADADAILAQCLEE
jgi:hypothetical protein